MVITVHFIRLVSRFPIQSGVSKQKTKTISQQNVLEGDFATWIVKITCFWCFKCVQTPNKFGWPNLLLV